MLTEEHLFSAKLFEYNCYLHTGISNPSEIHAIKVISPKYFSLFQHLERGYVSKWSNYILYMCFWISNRIRFLFSYPLSTVKRLFGLLSDNSIPSISQLRFSHATAITVMFYIKNKRQKSLMYVPSSIKYSLVNST